jgi:peptide chain release factor 3
LALDAAPLYWPAGSGQRFKGMLDLGSDEFLVFRRPEAGDADLVLPERIPIQGNSIAATLGPDELAELTETAALAREGLPAFDVEAFRAGSMTPVLFGSALRRFGVSELLDVLETFSPGPRAQAAAAKGVETEIAPGADEVTGFVFKIQANMDPKHRDRVAFFRVCSGRFRRGMTLKSSLGRSMNVHNPMMFMAQDREIADEAFPGDVIGIPNHGVLRVGDSLSESGQVSFRGIPNFAPEILKRCRVADPLKQKHLRKALESLAEEGVTQLFKPTVGADLVIGAVGALQFDVLEERLKAEYGLDVLFETSPFQAARWVSAPARADVEAFVEKNKMQMADDLDGAPVYLGKSAWEIGYVQDKNPAIRFSTTKERFA